MKSLNAYASERVLDISHQKLVSYDKETRIIPQEENSRPHWKAPRAEWVGGELGMVVGQDAGLGRLANPGGVVSTIG